MERVIICGVDGYKPGDPLPVQRKDELKTKSFETVTVTNAATTLVGPTYTTSFKQTKAIITVEVASIRIRTDGTHPTATVGHLVNSGDTIKLDSIDEITSFHAIRTGSLSAVLSVTYLEVAV